MAARSAARLTFSDRRAFYFVLALAVAIPLVVFGVARVDATSFRLDGPGGPALAFSAGVLSFVSPCVLPIVPIYITHISGAAIENGKVIADRRVTFSHAVAFILGLSLIFIALGASAGLLGSYVLRDNQRGLEQVAGMLVMLMGVILIPAYGRRSPMKSALLLFGLTVLFLVLVELGNLNGQTWRLAALVGVFLVAWLRFAGYIQFSVFSRTFQADIARNRQVGYSRSFMIGGAFALGWTPCIGPILGGILGLAATTSASTADAWTATYLLAFYSAGFSVPFLITGLALSDATRMLKRVNPYLGFIEVVAGLMLIAVGSLLVSGRITALNEYFTFSDFNQGL